MTTYSAIDCQGFAGGFTYGVHQAGFNVVAKRELPGGFGAASVLEQKHIFGELDYEESEWFDWTTRDAEFVFGNPPCSGFSNLTRSDFRGIDSPINSCMFAFAEYVARVRPYVAVYESVQGAFKTGRPLMQHLRDLIEARTGEQWDLWHVLHNGYTLGGPSIRPRYFFVVARIPLGFETPELRRVPLLRDVIGDLSGMNYDRLEDQAYSGPPTWWAAEQDLRRDDGFVDGHVIMKNPMTRRVRDLMRYTEWGNRETLADVCKRVYDENGGMMPVDIADAVMNSWPDKSWRLGYNQPIRWDPDRAGRVVTGSGMHVVVHPWESRTITLREAYRLQGFSDDWRLTAPVRKAKGVRGAAPWPGKGIPVQAGRWISNVVKRSLDGDAGLWRGEVVGDRERVVDVTYDYKKLYNDRKGTFEDSRNRHVLEAMQLRTA